MHLPRILSWLSPAAPASNAPATKSLATQFAANYHLIPSGDEGYVLCPQDGRGARLSISADMLRTLPPAARQALACAYALVEAVHIAGGFDEGSGAVTQVTLAGGIQNRASLKGPVDKSFPVPHGGSSSYRAEEHAYFKWHPDGLRPIPRHPEVSIGVEDGRVRMHVPQGHTQNAFGYEFQFYQRVTGGDARSLWWKREDTRPADWAPWPEVCPGNARDRECLGLMRAILPLFPRVAWFAKAEFEQALSKAPIDREAMRALLRRAATQLDALRAAGQTPAANNPIGSMGITPATVMQWIEGLAAEDVSPKELVRRLGPLLRPSPYNPVHHLTPAPGTWQDPHRLLLDMKARLSDRYGLVPTSGPPMLGTYFDREFMQSVVDVFEVLKARSAGVVLPRDIEAETREAHAENAPEWRLWSTPESLWGYPLECPEERRAAEAALIREEAGRLLGSEPKSAEQAQAQAWAKQVIANPHDPQAALAQLRTFLQRPPAESSFWRDAATGQRWLKQVGDEAAVPMWQVGREMLSDLLERSKTEYIDGPLLSSWGTFLCRVANDVFGVWGRRAYPVRE